MRTAGGSLRGDQSKLAIVVSMTIMPAVETVVEEDLETLFKESIANPCDCDHEPCAPRCKGHHLDLPSVNRFTGESFPGGPGHSPNPCPSGASWVVSISANLLEGFIPPSPRYLCDTCKNFWSSNDFLKVRAERL